MPEISYNNTLDQIHSEVTNSPKTIIWLKNGIWGYFFLLLFEGALRKWLLPGMATPLLVVRDPLTLWILIVANRRGLIPFNFYIAGMVLVGIISIFTAIFLGHKNLPVAVYGSRILLLHFPLIFVIGKIFSKGDVIHMGRIMAYTAIPMTVLIALQFYSPQSDWVNRGVGGDLTGAGFSGSEGYFRPPGTFSFTNGTSLFYSLLAPFIFYFWLHPGKINKWVLIAATVCLLISIPLSISRGLFFLIIVTLLFVVLATIQKPKYGKFVLVSGVGVLVGLLILSNFSFFENARNAFTARYELANEVEGGVKGVLADRYLGGMIGALTDNSSHIPFFGYGIGMGTNVGSMLLTGGTQFLISEGEWGRLIGESGILIGLIVIFSRLGVSAKMAVAAYQQLAKDNLLPWFLLSFALLQIPQGQWAQPTSLGFSILIGGLLIASLKDTKSRTANVEKS